MRVLENLLLESLLRFCLIYLLPFEALDCWYGILFTGTRSVRSTGPLIPGNAPVVSLPGHEDRRTEMGEGSGVQVGDDQRVRLQIPRGARRHDYDGGGFERHRSRELIRLDSIAFFTHTRSPQTDVTVAQQRPPRLLLLLDVRMRIADS